jgi:hypothetical protein
MWNALVVVEHFGNRVKGAIVKDVAEIKEVLEGGFEHAVRRIFHDAPDAATHEEVVAALAAAPAQEGLPAGDVAADIANPAVITPADAAAPTKKAGK